MKFITGWKKKKKNIWVENLIEWGRWENGRTRGVQRENLVTQIASGRPTYGNISIYNGT